MAAEKALGTPRDAPPVMKYFTPDLYQRQQDFSSDEAMDAAEQTWEAAAQRYRRALKRIFPGLPPGLKSLVQDFYLHDAEVLSIGQEKKTFLLVLRLDVPPRQLLVLKYRLVTDAVIIKHPLPEGEGAGPTEWMYDEVGAARGKKPSWSHSILLSNGWEVRLQVSDVEVLRAETVYPLPGTILVPVPAGALPQPA